MDRRQLAVIREGSRGLTGDRKKLPPGTNATMVDVEFEEPGIFLVQGVASHSAIWRVTIGLERARTRVQEVAGDTFGFAVAARSVVLTAEVPTSGQLNLVTAVLTPMELSSLDAALAFYDRAYRYQESFGPPYGVVPGFGLAPLLPIITNEAIGAVAQTAAPVAFPIGTRTVQNDATSTSTLYLAINDSGVNAGNYTVAMVPGAYWEMPQWAIDANPMPQLHGVWAGAGPGFAAVTSRVVT